MVSGKKRKEAEPATASGTKLGRRNQLANWASGSSLDGRGGSTEPTDPPPPSQPTGLSDQHAPGIPEFKKFWEAHPDANNELIMTTFPAALYNSRVFQVIKSLKPAIEANPLKQSAFWLYGIHDAGKSTLVQEIAKALGLRYYKVPASTSYQYWEQYDNEEVVELAELTPENHPPAALMKDWFDKWPFIVHVKCGSVKARPKLMFVTSNHSMRDVYREKEVREIPALMSRMCMCCVDLATSTSTA